MEDYKDISETTEKQPEKKSSGFLKAKIIAGLLAALAIFGFGFYLGTKYYRWFLSLAFKMMWVIPLVIVLLVVAVIIYFVARKKFKK